jgi:hypothetical protein
MSGAIAMGTNKITGVGDPTSNQDAATKVYVDGILGSATSAATSAAAAASSASAASSSASAAASSAGAASSSASAASSSATAAAASYDAFDDRYLGEKASNPTVDNDGNALITGALYFNNVADEMRVYNGAAFQAVAPVATTIALGSQVTGTLPIANGGTGTTSTTFVNLATNVTGTLPTTNGGTGLSTLGTAGQALVVNSGATGLEYATIDTNATLGTLTKTFTANEVSTISLTKSVLTPVVSVTKEVPQTGVTNNEWDVNSTTENYERLNSAPATTLNFVGFDVSTSVFVDAFSVSAQETAPRGIAFNTDGTKMFIVGTTGDDVNEYTLSTGFDVSTSTFVDAFSVASQDTSPVGIAFSTNGTKMFIVGLDGVDVNEYTLSTGFDVSTATFVDSFSVSSQDNDPQGIAFNTDGTKMFIVGGAGQDVNEYTLSTGFDVSTASFVDAFSVSAQDTFPAGIAFNSSGTKMFVVGGTGQDVY